MKKPRAKVEFQYNMNQPINYPQANIQTSEAMIPRYFMASMQKREEYPLMVVTPGVDGDNKKEQSVGRLSCSELILDKELL